MSENVGDTIVSLIELKYIEYLIEMKTEDCPLARVMFMREFLESTKGLLLAGPDNTLSQFTFAHALFEYLDSVNKDAEEIKQFYTSVTGNKFSVPDSSERV